MCSSRCCLWLAIDSIVQVAWWDSDEPHRSTTGRLLRVMRLPADTLEANLSCRAVISRMILEAFIAYLKSLFRPAVTNY
jgi:hypothetical protein